MPYGPTGASKEECDRLLLAKYREQAEEALAEGTSQQPVIKDGMYIGHIEYQDGKWLAVVESPRTTDEHWQSRELGPFDRRHDAVEAVAKAA